MPDAAIPPIRFFEENAPGPGEPFAGAVILFHKKAHHLENKHKTPERAGVGNWNRTDF
jgi:hypothetical protein